MSEGLSRDDIEAGLEVRRTMGPEMESAMVDSFADRIEAEVQRRIGQELELRKSPAKSKHLTLAIASLVMSIPLSAIASGTAGLPGLLIVWTAIVLINIAFGMFGQDPRGRR